MARLPPLLPTPPATLKLQDTDALESSAPKRHRPLEPPALDSRRREPNSPPPSKVRGRSRSPPQYKVQRRSRSPSPSKVRRRSRSPPYKVRRRSRSPPPSKVRRRSRSPPPSEGRRRSRSPSPSKVRLRSRSRSRSPLPSRVWRRSRSPLPSKARRRSRSPQPSKVKRRSRSPPYVSVTQRAKRPSAEAAVEGEKARPSSLDESSMENRPSHSHCSCKHAETSSAEVEKKPDPVIRGNEQELHSEKMDGKNQSDHKAPSRNARRKWVRRRVWAEAKNQMREMKRDKLLEKIKKLQDCVWLLEKDGADMAEIMELRSLLESTKKQYEENEAHLAQQGTSASHQVLNKDILKTHVETVPSPVEIVERDEQNMDSGEAEGRSLKGCKVVSNENELAEELNRLSSEIETARQDRDYQSAQAQSLMADMAKQKEIARIYGVELEDAMRRVAALEEEDLLQRETIRTLQVQLASANEKLTVCNG